MRFSTSLSRVKIPEDHKEEGEGGRGEGGRERWWEGGGGGTCGWNSEEVMR